MRTIARTLLPVLALAALGALLGPRVLHAAAPVLPPIGNRTVAEGQPLTVTQNASDADGDVVMYFGPVLPPGATFNSSTGTFTWTPLFTQSGIYPGLTFGASDGTEPVSETIAITVTDVNRSPTAVANGPYIGSVGTSVRFTSTGSSDPEGTTLASTWSFGDGANGTGAVAFHAFAAPGTYPVSLAVSDGSLTHTVPTTVSITAPTSASSTNAPPGAAVSLTLSPPTTATVSGATTTFVATARDANGVITDVTSATTFSTDDPRGSVVGATYTAGKVGTWTVQGDYGGVRGTSNVTVTPGVLALLSVNPNSAPEEVTQGSTRAFTAEAFDAHSNPVDHPAVAWSVAGDIGTVGTDGQFTAKKLGSGAIVAESNGVLAESAVRVIEAPAEQTLKNVGSTPSTGTNATTPTNGAAPVVLGTEDVQAQDSTPTATVALNTTKPCSTLRWWGWLGILLAYWLMLFGVLYATRRVTGPLFWVLPAALTVVVVWAFLRYRCDNFYPWFPWLTVIGGLLLALFRPPPPEPPIVLPPATPPLPPAPV